MIETIEIMIKNVANEQLSVLVMCSENICYKNNKKYKVTKEFIEDLIRTIRLWKTEYGNSENIDSEEFTIVVKTGEQKEMFHGKGVFPNNYQYLMELLGELYD